MSCLYLTCKVGRHSNWLPARLPSAHPYYSPCSPGIPTELARDVFGQTGSSGGKAAWAKCLSWASCSHQEKGPGVLPAQLKGHEISAREKKGTGPASRLLCARGAGASLQSLAQVQQTERLRPRSGSASPSLNNLCLPDCQQQVCAELHASVQQEPIF